MKRREFPFSERVSTILFLLSCASLVSVGLGQSIEVSDPRLELRGNVVYISYDILNTSPSDKFTVDLTITDDNGNEIRAAALSGDIGRMVGGGNNKEITWDLQADRVEIRSKIIVQVHVKAAQREAGFSPEITEEAKGPEGKEGSARDASGMENVRSLNRSMVILQAAALPGLGLSRVTGKPHWIKGIAGYGCIAGSVIMNRQAISTAGGIYDYSEFDQKKELYQKALTQDNISEALAYAAIGIWVADLIWTVAGTSNLKNSPVAANKKGLMFHATVEPFTAAPVAGIIYRF